MINLKIRGKLLFRPDIDAMAAGQEEDAVLYKNLFRVMIAGVVLPLFALVQGSSALAQRVPFLSDADYRYLVNEISGDSSYEFIRLMTQYHRPRGGAEGLMEVARYIERKAREFGLEDVRLIKQPAENLSWNATRADLWMVEPEWQRICSMDQVRLHLADNSRSTDVVAGLIDVGRGSEDSDYEGKEVKDKIVLAYGSIPQVMNQAVWKRGALGMVYRSDPSATEYPLNSLNHPDQVRWIGIPWESQDGKPGTFAFGLSTRQGLELKAKLDAAKTPVKVHAKIDAVVGADKWQVMVEGFLRGTEIQNQDIVLTGHMQEEKYSANDDASGCANVLEIARTLSKMMRENSLPRPRRNIRFWWVTEISSERQFFADYPEEARKLLVNINQDMVGANQSQDVMRVQNVTRVPFSRFHFLNDIAEAVVAFTMASNTSQLSQAEAGAGTLYPKPILSHLGTRHRYNAAMIPFHNSTDHMTFTEAPIGVPGITFTNWPDNYIHTSDDDLWNIDRTQLQRNAFAVAAMAYYIARANAASIPGILAEMSGRAAERMAQDYRVAQTLILDSIPAGRAEAMKAASNQLQQALVREIRALQSLAVLDPTNSQGKLLAGATEQLQELHGAFAKQLARFFLETTGSSQLPAAELTATEKELQQMLVQPSGGPKEFLTGRNKVKPVPKLHSLMAFETSNLIDGERNGLEIYQAVSAEARRAGEHYYGTVTPEMVRDCLKNLVDSGLFSLKK